MIFFEFYSISYNEGQDLMAKEVFLEQRSLLDFDNAQEQEVKVIDEKIVNIFDSSRITPKINKSGKIIEAVIKDNESEEAISRNEYKLFNAILSICQNHPLGSGVPKHIYVGASTLAKMMNISRQQANSKVEFKGKTITFLEEKLYSLQKKTIYIKEAILPTMDEFGRYVTNKEGNIVYSQEQDIFFSIVPYFSTVGGGATKTKIFKIEIPSIFFSYMDMRVLNEKNGMPYATLDTNVLNNFNDQRAIRFYELLILKARGLKQGSFMVLKDDLVKLFNIKSNRLKQYLDRVASVLESSVKFTYGMEKIQGVSWVRINFVLIENHK